MLVQFNLNLVEFGLLSLAAWRITHFIVEERGPFNVMGWIREHIFRFQYFPKTATYFIPAWSEVFSCVWCLGIYMWILLFIMRLYILSAMNFVILSLAASAVIIFIEEKISD